MAKKKVLERCDCARQVNEKLALENAKLCHGLETNFTTGVVWVSPPYLKVEKKRSLRDGKKLPVVVCTFCPFCGVKYPD